MDTDTESDYDYEEPAIKVEAVDGDGQKILDDKGNTFFKVCGDEDVENDEGAEDEMKELGSFSRSSSSKKLPTEALSMSRTQARKILMVRGDDESTASEAEDVQPVKLTKTIPKEAFKIELDEGDFGVHSAKNTTLTKKPVIAGNDEDTASEVDEESEAQPNRPSVERDATKSTAAPAKRPPTVEGSDIGSKPTSLAPQPAVASTTPGVCKICSLENGKDDLTCAACGHVLDTTKLRNYWGCRNSSCKDLGYLNVGDNGICGLCGTAKA
jgi:hypothetical protein